MATYSVVLTIGLVHIGDVLCDRYDIVVAGKNEYRDTRSKTRRSGCRRWGGVRELSKLTATHLRLQNLNFYLQINSDKFIIIQIKFRL